MNLHEYQGKEILKQFGVTVQEGLVVDDPDKLDDVYHQLQKDTNTEYVVVKAQIHAGGRGKGGGVKLAKNKKEYLETANDILGMMLKTPQTPGGMNGEGKLVQKILVAEDVYAPDFEANEEIYISVLTDRERNCNVIVYSTEGGMDIESVAEETPEKVFKELVDPELGLLPFQKRKIAFNLGLEGVAFKGMMKFVDNLYKAFISSDASLIEINPCLRTGDDRILAVDCKVTIDNNALFRHPDIAEMRDESEEDSTEVEARKHGLSYVKLDGNVGCMVNGAGLAMATMDMIKLYGGEPANFLDVGGTADAGRVEQAFRIILRDENVKAILINIFGGIVRCDRVAKGVVEAAGKVDINVPVIVRLQGTNAELGKKIMDESGLKVVSAILLEEAAEAVQKALK